MRQFKCRKSKVQEYDCMVCVRPRWRSSHKWIGFDKCLADELFCLWDMGIITTGSCCGHHEGQNGKCSSIGVVKRFIPKMKKLGYKVWHNPSRPNDEDIFIPKTNLL